MAIVASMLVERTERGDEMFMTMLARHSQHALDLDADELLAAADSAPAPPLRPAPHDEGRHAPGSEPLWNESWYFDAIARDGSIGAYVRVGLLPAAGRLLVHRAGVRARPRDGRGDRLRRAAAGRASSWRCSTGLAARRAPLRAAAAALLA